MPLLRQRDSSVFCASDFRPPKIPGDVIRFQDFELWGYWVNAIAEAHGIPIVDLLAKFKLWFGVMEVEG